MRYQVNVTRKGKTTVSAPMAHIGYARTEARKEAAVKGTSVVTITRDSEGADHPANAGKFFLHEIIK